LTKSWGFDLITSLGRRRELERLVIIVAYVLVVEADAFEEASVK